MGSTDEIVKLKERLKLVEIEDIVGKAKMHAAEAYSHAKEAYSLRDEFFKLIEQHAAYGGDVDSGTKERLSLAAASLNAALLGVADAAVSTATMSSRAAQGANQCLLDYNLLAAKASRVYESSSSSVLKDEKKATNLDAADSESAPRTESPKLAVAQDKEILSGEEEEEEVKLGCEKASNLEKMAHLETVREEAVARVGDDEKVADADIAANHDQDKPAPTTESTKLDREAVVAQDKKIEEEVRLEEGGGCEKETSLEKMAHLREGLTRDDAAALEKVTDAASDSDQEGIASLLAAQTASFFSSLTQIASCANLDAGERSVQRDAKLARDKKTERMAKFVALRESLARVREDAALEADSDPALLAASTSLGDAAEKLARTEAVREEGLRKQEDLLREEEESRRLEAEVKAKKECKKKKREEENKMRDDKRKQKMDKNTKPKDKGKAARGTSKRL